MKMGIKENKYRDQKLVFLWLLLFAVSMACFIGYKVYIRVTEGTDGILTSDMKRSATVDGYDSPEKVAEYVLYWINKGDLDMALRGCAIEEVSEYFSLQRYCEIMNEFSDIENLAPADYDHAGFISINKLRMTSVYSGMVEQCMGVFGEDYDLRILNIYTDIPKNADGYYFSDIRDICAIVGARDACNVVVVMEVNGVVQQMTVTAARYKQNWKVLQFSAYENYQYEEPQIEEVASSKAEGELPLVWEDMEKQMLPLNYKIVCDNSEEEIEKLLHKWFIYLQRGDMVRASSYFDIYDGSTDIYFDTTFFDIQNEIAKRMQHVYYKLFLYNQDSLNWIKQNPKEEAGNLLRMLDVDDMLKTKLTSVEILEESNGYAKCQIQIKHDVTMSYVVELIYRDGWKISSIE